MSRKQGIIILLFSLFWACKNRYTKYVKRICCQLLDTVDCQLQSIVGIAKVIQILLTNFVYPVFKGSKKREEKNDDALLPGHLRIYRLSGVFLHLLKTWEMWFSTTASFQETKLLGRNSFGGSPSAPSSGGHDKHKTTSHIWRFRLSWVI